MMRTRLKAYMTATGKMMWARKSRKMTKSTRTRYLWGIFGGRIQKGKRIQ